MKITTTVTKTELVEKEITLPRYSVDSIGTYYRINEDESVLSIYASKDNKYLTLEVAQKDSITNHVGRALQGEIVTEEQFREVLERAITNMDATIASLSKSAA